MQEIRPVPAESNSSLFLSFLPNVLKSDCFFWKNFSGKGRLEVGSALENLPKREKILSTIKKD